MREPYGEGLASHTDPESCGHDREVVVEALTGARVGRVLSREIHVVRGADAVFMSEGKTASSAIASYSRAPSGLRPRARTEAPRARTGRSRDRPSQDGATDRRGKPQGEIQG